MVLPKEPVPGQKLDATWGRDIVRALKRLTPSGGPGMRVTCGPNGTTFAAVGRAAQAGATEQEAEAELLSFRIGVGVETIESGSSVTYKYHCVAVCADLMTDGVGYSEINTTVPDDSKLGGLPLGKAGSGLSWVWLKDADFADVTEESETSPTENVYLHIDRTRHLCVLANADTLTIPDGTDFTSDDHICVASFTPPTKDAPKPSVCGQYVLGSLVDLCEAKDELYPFKLKRVNEGTEASPKWKTIVYLPDGAVQIEDGDYKYASENQVVNRMTAIDGEDSWYYVEGDGAEVYLMAYLQRTVTREAGADGSYSTSWSAPTVDFVVYAGETYDGMTTTSVEGSQQANERKRVAIGSVDATENTTENSVRSVVTFSIATINKILVDSVSTSGGGDSGDTGGSGTVVSVTDNREDANVPGLLGMDGAAQAEGTLKLIAYDGLGFDKVVAGDGANQTTLTDYLAGSVEVTAGDSKLGKNINTENFETECLAKGGESADTTVGSATTASRSDHKHKKEDIVMEGEDGSLLSIFSNVESYLKLLRDIGAITEEDSTEVPRGDQTVTFDDITQGVDGTIGATGIGSDTSDLAPLTGDNAEYILSEADLTKAGVHQGEWDRDTDTAGQGFKYTVCCGVKHIPSKYGVYLIFREITVDKYGMIRKISKAKMGLYQNLV